MSLSRARTRFAAVAAAVPVLIAGSPFLAATAVAADVSDVRQAQLVETQGKLRIGPRAGFRGDVARGVNGNTAIVAFDASPSTTLKSASVTVAQSGPFSIYDDFDSTDGFALYKDLDDNNRLDLADHAAGPVSFPQYDIGFSGGSVVVTVTADPAKATGEDSYLLTVHPAANLSAERNVDFAVPANGIATTAGSIPAAKVALSPILLDSKAPAAIPTANFTPVSRAPQENCPSSNPADCGDDFYKVFRATPAEENEKLAFFNALGDLSDGALLQRANPEGAGTVPAIFDVAGISDSSTSPTTLFIGNGTGRDSSVPGSRALNNQIGDDLVAVQWDPIGNVAATPLNNTPTCDQNNRAATCPEQPLKGNDVTGPALTYSVTMAKVDAAANPASVEVKGTITATTDQGVHAWVKRTTVEQIARPEHVRQVAGSNPATYEAVAGHVGAEKRSAPRTPGAAGDFLSYVDVSSATLFPQDELVRSQARLVDAYGNAAPNKATAPVLKDTIRPAFTKVSLIDANGDGDADKGEVYTVEFNDGMNRTDITSSNVNTQLTVDDPNATCGPSDTLAPCITWGELPQVSWSADGKLLSITLGEPCATVTANCPRVAELPQTGDEVTAASGVRDKNLNAFATGINKVIIVPPAVLPLQARTIDTPNLGANAFSTTRDGVIDAIDVEFTGALKSDTISGTASKFEITSGDKVVVPSSATLVTGTTDTIRLTFTVPTADKALFGTGATPTVTLNNAPDSSATGLEGGNGDLIAAFSRTSVDRAPAVPLSMKTNDANNDGKLDRVLVQFSEAIVHGKENPCGYWVGAPYGDTSYQPAEFNTAAGSGQSCPTDAANPARNQPSPATAGATASDTVALKLAVQPTHDTHAAPQVWFSSTKSTPNYSPTAASSAPKCMNANAVTGATTPDCPLMDAAGNGLGSFTGITVDAAGPAIVERNTADNNSDGRLDEIRIKFSENLSTPSIANAQFTISDPSYTIQSLDVVAQRDLALRIENVPSGQGDTGVKPKLTFLGGTTDVAGVATTPDTGVVVTDKAGPALLGACASSPAGTNGQCPVDDAATDKVTLLFSETVTASSANQQADYVVEQPAGTAKTQTAAPVVDADNKRVTLTFAQGAINSAEDGVVRLAAAGAVTDAATPVNPSVQVTNVPLFKVPTVSLSLSCPSPANPGYCVDDKIDTGASGSTGVTRWRLAETARGTTPADSEYKDAIPAVYPESGPLTEGKHTLYLSGKDAFGRLTPEVSQSITVLKAPKILGVQLVNSETPRLSGSWKDSDTVRDGDSLKIGADAYGTDAAEWAANDAPIGGGCLAQHMSINVKALTGVSTHTAVAPVQCDLNTATAPDHRQMQFPVVKVSGTTKYPVGTVVKISDSDPGSMIVDGPNGTQLRRPFISASARRSWMITDASVIKVSSSLLSGLAKGANLGYRSGALLRTGSGYYYVENGVKRPVSTTQLSAWRMSTSTAYSPTTTELKGMPTGTRISGAAHAAGTWIKYSDGRIYQVVKNAQGTNVRRRLASTAALRTLVPTSHIYAANSSDSKLPVDTWLRGYRDGTVLKLSSGFGVVSRGSLRKFANVAAFNTLGYATSNALSASGLAMPRVSGQAYRIGETIDRYKITGTVIKVTNKAGTSVTETVLPTLGGVYGVGTLDPVPPGWDFTR